MPSADAFLALVAARRGHFRMESGYHATLWLDLDALFARPAAIAPFVDDLAAHVRPFGVDAVCGPLLGGAFVAYALAERLGVECWHAAPARPAEGTELFRARYALPHAFRGRARGRRVAIVDDVMSAGSSLRATADDLDALGAHVACAGALLRMGDVGAAHFAARGVPVVAAAAAALQTWAPDACPRCIAGDPLEDVAPV